MSVHSVDLGHYVSLVVFFRPALFGLEGVAAQTDLTLLEGRGRVPTKDLAQSLDLGMCAQAYGTLFEEIVEGGTGKGG